MQKSYKYKKHIFLLNKILKFVLLPIDALILILGIIFDPELIFIGVVLTIISILEIVLYRRFVTTEITLDDSGIHFQNIAKDIQIPYEDIISVDSKSIRYTGGWLLIHYQGGKPLRLMITIDHIDDFVLELKLKLVELEMQAKFDNEKLFDFYKTSIYAHQSWNRDGKFIGIYFIALFLFGFGDVVVAVVKDNPLGLIFYILAVILGSIPFFYVEFGIYMKEIKNYVSAETWVAPIPDPILEKKRMRFVTWFMILLMLASFIASLAL